jgi:predicted aldo/keto reductase-like oxidoreductase
MAEESLSDEQGVEIVRAAIDRGVTFLDNAWVYNDGRSETLMGRALRDGYREKVLLMTKLENFTLEGIKKQLENSLERFGLDSFDLMQFHMVARRDEYVDDIYKNGVIEWAEDMRSQGVFKYIGFTGHGDPKAHIEMIKRGYPWDTVQMPLNPGDYNRNVSYERDVLPLAIENNIGVIAMKTNGGGRLGNSQIATPVEGLRYAMSLPVSTVCSGINSMEILDENVNLFQNFTPMTEEEMSELRNRAVGKSDEIEGYRRKKYDSEGNVIPKEES